MCFKKTLAGTGRYLHSWSCQLSLPVVKGIEKRMPCGLEFLSWELSSLIIDAVLRPGWDRFQGRYFIPVMRQPPRRSLLSPARADGAAMARWVITGWHWSSLPPPSCWTAENRSAANMRIWNTSRLDQVTIQNFSMRAPVGWSMLRCQLMRPWVC